MAAFTELLGKELVTKDGVKPTADVLSGKSAVGLYFSAHWCPPCRGFTPELGKMYSGAFKSKGMEIVFVSSDRDAGAFKEYYGEQPWCAVPFEAKEVKAALDKKFKVQGIPTLVILDSDAKLITKDGRAAVSKDPSGEKYPWKPPSKAEVGQLVLSTLGKDLVAKSNGKYIGLYFSAHWCPPCRGFTPKLAEYYKNGLKDKMEIIFVSSDRDEASFKEYFAEQPWSALPYSDRRGKEVLSELCGVEGIPTFAVFNPDGSLLTTEGRGMVVSDPTGATLPDGWKPQPIKDCNDDPEDLNSEMCIVALGTDEALAKAVKEVALKYYEKAGQEIEEMPYRFYTAPPGGVTDKVKSLFKIDGNHLVITDLPNGEYYICPEPVSDAAGVEEFLESVKDGEARKKTLG
mmetsp:Transcript_73862/g.153904  ORF Transcript_73862/g.153904 Transcript_73862/m.153904 type:complete len:402 (-) Transcript_73862:77-1282(-)|eukprot:CAMPEP_0206464144 /NCGR_PEP_ID=MMETSP0324_2-20121206/27038_1 /ASSEMBLY_ACC=CAM_ASM_000836 /TAXON_ID=2866 /ORGANISM="Crypthecodinium cohnii, Strain Seligo" /LENGTH=401 /DNA_ID=CAMNT_0053936713 /DNA_START=54 /DNA_END=1259 /DNA_ORIENTATION=+